MRVENDSAEIAFAVADEHQQRGIGSALTRELVGDARAAGIIEITALVSSDNPAAVALLRRIANVLHISFEAPSPRSARQLCSGTSRARPLSPFRQKTTSPRYQRLGARQPIPSRTDQQHELRTIGITRKASGHTGPTRRTARSQDLSSATSCAKEKHN